MSTSASADEEALRAELRKKERDLLLAARYGKGLLEENERIKRDLENAKQELANAMEVSGVDITISAVHGKYYTCSYLHHAAKACSFWNKLCLVLSMEDWGSVYAYNIPVLCRCSHGCGMLF